MWLRMCHMWLDWVHAHWACIKVTVCEPLGHCYQYEKAITSQRRGSGSGIACSGSSSFGQSGERLQRALIAAEDLTCPTQKPHWFEWALSYTYLKGLSSLTEWMAYSQEGPSILNWWGFESPEDRPSILWGWTLRLQRIAGCPSTGTLFNLLIDKRPF